VSSKGLHLSVTADGIVTLNALIVIVAALLVHTVQLISSLQVPSSLPDHQLSEQRYHELRRELPVEARPGNLYFVDSVQVDGLAAAHVGAVIQARATSTIDISGWAVDGPDQSCAAAFTVVLNGITLVPTSYGSDRNDVAAAYHRSAYRFSGFRATIRRGTLLPGVYTVDFVVLSSDKKRLLLIRHVLTLNVQR
jgi:hypothetical protein